MSDPVTLSAVATSPQIGIACWPSVLPACWASVAYSQAERAHAEGQLTADQWGAYCWAFRDGAYRFSDLGRADAVAFAERHSLPLPYSDRPIGGPGDGPSGAPIRETPR